MGCRPLCDIDVVLQIASDNSTGMKNYRDWDCSSCITEQQTATLLNRIECVYNTNRWSGVAIMDKNAPVAFAASDASDRFGGQIMFNDIGDIIDSKTMTWSTEFNKTHIFLKELLAACLTVENILKAQPLCKVIYLPMTTGGVVAAQALSGIMPAARSSSSSKRHSVSAPPQGGVIAVGQQCSDPLVSFFKLFFIVSIKVLPFFAFLHCLVNESPSRIR